MRVLWNRDTSIVTLGTYALTDPTLLAHSGVKGPHHTQLLFTELCLRQRVGRLLRHAFAAACTHASGKGLEAAELVRMSAHAYHRVSIDALGNNARLRITSRQADGHQYLVTLPVLRRVALAHGLCTTDVVFEPVTEPVGPPPSTQGGRKIEK